MWPLVSACLDWAQLWLLRQCHGNCTAVPSGLRFQPEADPHGCPPARLELVLAVDNQASAVSAIRSSPFQLESIFSFYMVGSSNFQPVLTRTEVTSSASVHRWMKAGTSVASESLVSNEPELNPSACQINSFTPLGCSHSKKCNSSLCQTTMVPDL